MFFLYVLWIFEKILNFLNFLIFSGKVQQVHASKILQCPKLFLDVKFYRKYVWESVFCSILCLVSNFSFWGLSNTHYLLKNANFQVKIPPRALWCGKCYLVKSFQKLPIFSPPIGFQWFFVVFRWFLSTSKS